MPSSGKKAPELNHRATGQVFHGSMWDFTRKDHKKPEPNDDDYDKGPVLVSPGPFCQNGR